MTGPALPPIDGMHRALRWSASQFLALGIVVAHVLLPLYGRRMSQWASPEEFVPVAVLLALVLVVCLEGGSSPSLCLKPRPSQGWEYWVRLACWFGLAIIAITLVAVGVLWAVGRSVPIPRTSPDHFAARLFGFCLFAPVVEELVYRALLTHALAGKMSDWALIATSGLLFGLVHVLYGNPGPDNLVAGFFLQWSLLKSGTILVPMAMHCAGNAIALLSQLVNWHVFATAALP
jgi:uncharacterized protein